MSGQPTPLTPGRIGLILVGMALLLGVSYWHFFLRELPGSTAVPVGRDAIRLTGDTMGTYFVVEIVPQSDSDLARAEEFANAVTAVLDDVDTKMSTYKPDSEISRFNSERTPSNFEFSETTFTVVQVAQRISDQTSGAFDITVGPLVDAWGFGPDGPTDAPDEATLAQLRERVGYRLLELDPVALTATKQDGTVAIDLSAIAKGYAVDRVAEALNELGQVDYMVEVGGEVRTRGVNASGQVWTIGIEMPDETIGGVVKTVRLNGMAMATSGDYRNFYERDGVRISHTIDPRIGSPVAHAAASVTVIHHECMYADAFATAMLVLGPDEGIALSDELGLPVLFLVHAENGFDERASAAFDSMFQD